MSRDRALLAIHLLDDFATWAATEGWIREPIPPKSIYEVLRLRYGATKTRAIYYQRDRATEHVTAHGDGVQLARRFVRARRQA